MFRIKKFVFSPFQENTYVLYSESGKAWVIDPGCYHKEEKNSLSDFISKEGLTVTRLLNTHCHLDHVFGNKFMCDTYNVLPEYHVLDEPTMDLAGVSAKMYGVDGFEDSPRAKNHLREIDKLDLDGNQFEIVFVPGHAPGHIAFINHEQKVIIGGDVLFRGSIGRTDLPGGDLDTLLNSIRNQFFNLAENFTVYSGHGEETTIGYEKTHNPFLT
jgi:hydroxyacylglutathione hydrolase